MGNEQFFQQLAELLEVPVGEITPNRKLEDFQLWDSLAMVSTLAIADQCFGARLGHGLGGALSLQSFIRCTTVSDILDMIQASNTVEATV